MKQFCTGLFFILLLTCSVTFAQIMEDDDYKFSVNYGVRLNTDGFGICYSRGKTVDIGKQRIISLDISNIKHEKETRLIDTQTGSSFILGKSLYLFAVRPDYGFKDRLFRKANKDGVEINWLWAAGPSFGVTKPYYIQFNEPSNYEPFDPDRHDPQNRFAYNTSVVGGGGFFRGFSELKLQPGAHGKIALEFEWGSNFDMLSAVQIGLMVDAYTKKILLIPQAENKAVFISLFGSYNFGRKW